MKLEKKHLAPYLIYDLEGYCLDNVHSVLKYFSENRAHCVTKYGNNVPIGDRFSLFKPMLIPLSKFNDLESVKDFLGVGNWCDAYDDYFDVWFNDVANTDKLILQCPYEIIQCFFKNHYDVFGLIDAGLAIEKQ